MRLGVLLTLSFLAVALLVGFMGYLFGLTSGQVAEGLVDLGRSSDVLLGANRLAVALERSQLAAEALVAERFRAQFEASHESEWFRAADIDRDEILDSLEEFDDHLAASWEATRRPQRAMGGGNEAGSDLESRLLRVEREWSGYKTRINRFVHLVRYHPTEHVQEWLDDELVPHYRATVVPSIEEFGIEARRGFAAETESIARALARGDRRNRLVTAAALASALFLGILIARLISRPLARLTEAAEAIGKGKLEEPVGVAGVGEIAVLGGAFRRMVGDLQASTVSRGYLDNILQSMNEILIVTDPEGIIRTVNRAAWEEIGCSAEDLVGENVNPLVERSAEGSEGGEEFLRTADGARLPVLLSESVLLSDSGEEEGRVYLARNISTEKRIEEELRRSLREKEILLKEVHHRVKNNLQIVSSLLQLQGRENRDEGAGEKLRESRNRILSMALVHEQLYRSEDLTQLDFGAYLQELIDHIAASFGARAKGIRPELSVTSQPPSLDGAIPCGLIVNELVSNAFEHAFPDGRGTVAVRYWAEDGHHFLQVRDDGKGLPPDLEMETVTSLGLRLVSGLAKQLGGELALKVDSGSEMTLRYDPSMLS